MPISSVYTLFTIGSNGTGYSSWDGDQASMCVCYSGYTGPECEMIMCPKGDDPLTKTEDFRTISITTSATEGTLDGYFTFRFNNYYFDFPGHGSNWTKYDCRDLFQSMANVDIASCTMGEVGNDGSITVMVELREFPLRPVENNIYFHEGNPGISQFQCETAFVEGASGVRCAISDVLNDTALIPGDLIFRIILAPLTFNFCPAFFFLCRVCLLLEQRCLRLHHWRMHVLSKFQQFELRHIHCTQLSVGSGSIRRRLCRNQRRQR